MDHFKSYKRVHSTPDKLKKLQELEEKKRQEKLKLEQERIEKEAFESIKLNKEAIANHRSSISNETALMPQEKVSLVDALMKEDETFTHELEDEPTFLDLVIRHYPEITLLTKEVINTIHFHTKKNWNKRLQTADLLKKERMFHLQNKELDCLSQLATIIRIAQRKGNINAVRAWIHRLHLLHNPVSIGILPEMKNMASSLQDLNKVIDGLKKVNQKITKKYIEHPNNRLYDYENDMVFPEDLNQQARYEQERNLNEELRQKEQQLYHDIREQKLELREMEIAMKEGYLNRESHLLDRRNEIREMLLGLTEVKLDLREREFEINHREKGGAANVRLSISNSDISL